MDAEVRWMIRLVVLVWVVTALVVAVLT